MKERILDKVRHPPLQLLYEDDAVRAEYVPGDGPTVVVSFNSYSGEDGKVDRFGYPFLPRQGFATVYVTAKQNHWWQHPGIGGATDAVRAVVARYERAVTYGSSMGGYGALLLARDVGASHAVAVSPQTSISNPKLKLKETWRLNIAKRPIIRDDIDETLPGLTRAVILYDPYMPRDRKFFDYVAHHPNVVGFPSQFLSHKVLRALQEAKILKDVSVNLLRGEMDYLQYRAMVRGNRRRSPTYLGYLARCCTEKGHKNWAVRLQSGVDAKITPLQNT